MKIETKEKIENFQKIVTGLFKLLIGVSILLSSIALYNHFTPPEVMVNPKEPMVPKEIVVSECDCEKYVKEVYEGEKLGLWPLTPSYNWCDYHISFGDTTRYTVREMIIDGELPASERVKDCDQ